MFTNLIKKTALSFLALVVSYFISSVYIMTEYMIINSGKFPDKENHGLAITYCLLVAIYPYYLAIWRNEKRRSKNIAAFLAAISGIVVYRITGGITASILASLVSDKYNFSFIYFLLIVIGFGSMAIGILLARKIYYKISQKDEQ